MRDLEGRRLFGFICMILIVVFVSVYAADGACPDFDGDNAVGFTDFFLFSQYFDWHVNETTALYDVSKDDANKIDFNDFFAFSQSFGKKCGELGEGSQAQVSSEQAAVLPAPDACKQNIEACKKQVSFILSGRQKIAKLENTALHYYHSDHLGSTSKMTDENGEVVFSADYMPFGEELRKEGSEKFTYTGKELDDESGLYYYGARYYDAEVGRFTSVDPVPDAGNRYVYVRNNPLRLTDPDGREVDPDYIRRIAETGMDDVIRRGSIETVRVKQALVEFQGKGGSVDDFINLRNRVARDPGKVAAAASALKEAKKDGGAMRFGLVLTKLRGAKSVREKGDMLTNLVKSRPDLVKELAEDLAKGGDYAQELRLLNGIVHNEAKAVTQAARVAAKVKPPGLMAMGGGGIVNLVVGLFTGEVKVEEKPQTAEDLAAKGTTQKIESFRTAFYVIWGSDPVKNEKDKEKIDPKYNPLSGA